MAYMFAGRLVGRRVLTVLVAGTAWLAVGGGEVRQPLPALPVVDYHTQPAVSVMRVEDGDVLVVEQGEREVAVRLIGTYVPRRGSARPVAKAFLERLLIGERVHLTVEQEWPADNDAGQRWVYVWRSPDGMLVNLELIRQGYARLMAASPFAHQDVFREYERVARRHHKGIWQASPTLAVTSQPTTQPHKNDISETDPTAIVYVTEHGTKYHRAGCYHLRGGGKSMSLSEAREGGYEPCAHCKPPG